MTGLIEEGNMRDETIVNDILNHIKKEMNEIKFGKIVIELQDNSDKIDVLTEVRKRFKNNNK